MRQRIAGLLLFDALSGELVLPLRAFSVVEVVYFALFGFQLLSGDALEQVLAGGLVLGDVHDAPVAELGLAFGFAWEHVFVALALRGQGLQVGRARLRICCLGAGLDSVRSRDWMQSSLEVRGLTWCWCGAPFTTATRLVCMGSYLKTTGSCLLAFSKLLAVKL